MELNKIYNEDCLIGMKEIADKSVDMILCDLPYGTTSCKWDTIIPLEPLWEQYERVIKDNGAIVLTAGQPFTGALVMSNPSIFRYEWIWEKNQGVNFLLAKKQPLKVHENILIFYKKPPKYNPQMEIGEPYTTTGKGNSGEVTKKVKKIRTKNKGTRYPRTVQKIKREYGLHPTQKPVALFEYLIKTYTDEGETVLDNCMGSGTTAIACINTNRNYIGFELDEEYYETSIKRINNHVEDKQIDLFEVLD